MQEIICPFDGSEKELVTCNKRRKLANKRAKERKHVEMPQCVDCGKNGKEPVLIINKSVEDVTLCSYSKCKKRIDKKMRHSLRFCSRKCQKQAWKELNRELKKSDGK